jgi:ferrous iron transport protein B
MKKVVLVGNPNVGKSLLFSRITKTGTITANYAGTTIDLKIGHFSFQDEDYELVDGPGIYSLERFSEAEETSLRLIGEADLIIDVADATSLERNLGLSLRLISLGKPTIVCLNLWDDTVHKGIAIDCAALEAELGVPVVAASALSGEGIAELVSALAKARPGKLPPAGEAGPGDAGEEWKRIGEIVARVQKLSHRHHSFLERLSDLSLHPVGGILMALLVLVSTLLIVRFIGEWLATDVLGGLYARLYSPFVLGLAERITWPLLRGFLVGYSADPLQSFGVLTSGVYIAFVQVFPYFFAFYLVFGFLEDLGYLPRLALVLDRAFHRIGLHGYSAIPVMLGLGCKVPAFLSTRMLTDRREKILTITLIFMSAPCLPQTSMIVAMGMSYGAGTVLAVFGILLALAFAVNLALGKVWKGDSPDFFSEIPDYRIPSLRIMAGKLWMRVKEYLGEVIPMIALGVLIMNVLELAGILAAVTTAIQGPVSFLFGLPGEMAPIMLLGFLRKDVSIALLAPLRLSSGQFIVASVFLALYTPCVASFFTLQRETGLKTALRIVLLVFLAATLAAALLHLALGI